MRRLLPASWNADGERVAKTNVLLYFALPSFSLRLLFWLIFILAFYSANLITARAECTYRRLCDSRNGALKKLTNFIRSVRPSDLYSSVFILLSHKTRSAARYMLTFPKQMYCMFSKIQTCRFENLRKDIDLFYTNGSIPIDFYP